MKQDWGDLLLAFLHDPPDKALDVRGHVGRACRYASVALDQPISADAIGGLPDQLASIAERIPMPTAGDRGVRAVGPRDDQLTVFHPLSSERSVLTVGQIDEKAVERAIAEIVSGLDSPRDRFLAVWRLLPDKLAAGWPSSALLPADTRIPDHTIWQHLDITAGLKAALSGAHGAAFLSFALGPVQSFIESARSVRDLWSGSMILSWLTFQAMLPVVEQLGPTAVIHPLLRGVPLLDLWLHETTAVGPKITLPEAPLRRAPCLPNCFLAVVPWGQGGSAARELAGQCENAARRSWANLGNEVHSALDRVLKPICGDWDKRWREQLEGFFDVRTAVLPLREAGEQVLAALWGGKTFAEAFPEAALVRKLADAIPDDQCPYYLKPSNPSRTNLSGLWQAQVELSARLMESQRAIRHVPAAASQDGSVPPKCSLMGGYEQMGPDGLDDSRKFWETVEGRFRQSPIDGIRLRTRERFCAVALVKRFAEAALLGAELRLSQDVRRIPDSATIAASRWLVDARQRGFSLDLDNGQWLHWSSRSSEADEDPIPEDTWKSIEAARKHPELGAPPAYYAVLAMDGDEMGRWLRGENAPTVSEALHPDMQAYFAGLSDTAASLSARRPVGPALHAAISQALTNFALHVVPRIVGQHGGTLIYSGGDDVLALLPASTALACAFELRLAFSGDPRANGGAARGYYRADGRDLLVMGRKATASTGLAVVHYKEDLRFALSAARDAEKAAKAAGRNMLQVRACRRSGEHPAALCPWDFVGTVQSWVDAFSDGATDRWAYHLREELPTLCGLDHETVLAEIRRQIGRTEKPTQDRLPPDSVAAAFETYRAAMLAREAPDGVPGVPPGRRDLLAASALEGFVILCQTASFLARGREP